MLESKTFLVLMLLSLLAAGAAVAFQVMEFSLLGGL